MDEEPLGEWARRREQRRSGRLRVTILAAGPQAAHTNPDAPRLISEWNGYGWQATAVVPNLDAAKRFLHPEVNSSPEPNSPRPRPLAPGRGRHRRT